MNGAASLPPPRPGSGPAHETAAPSPPPTSPPSAIPPPPPQLSAPSGYIAYEGAYGHRAPLSPIARTARWASLLTVIAGVCGLAGAVLSASLAAKAQDFLDGRISEDAFLDANALAPVGQILTNVPMIAAGVFSMIWLYKVSTNVRALGRSTTFAPVFAILGWFLPPFLFVLPLLVIRELWKASAPDAPPGTDDWRQSGESPLLYVWFLLYGVLPAIVTVIGLPSLIDSILSVDTATESIADVAAATGPTQLILSGVLILASAAAWFLIVRKLTARHIELTGER